MIPYPYNMVDMGGIDLAEANGTVVEGLYAKIVEAVNACGDVVLYNWKFASIEIAPQHTSILVGEGSLLINGIIQVTELDVLTVLGIDPPIVPVGPLIVNENGIYTAEPPASGFNPVTVQVKTTSVLEGNSPPSSDIGSDGDYYIYNKPLESFIFGITITKAARGSDYNFTYWGARDIQIIFEDPEGNDIELSSISGASCYYKYSNSQFSLQNAVINGEITSSYYEHSGLPGYWKIIVPVIAGYKVKALKICLRDNSLYRDYYRSFTFGLWSNEDVLDGEPFVSVEDSIESDWVFNTYNVFNFGPVELTGAEPFFYKKINGEWILVK